MHCKAQHSSAQHSSAQQSSRTEHSTARHNTAQHSSAQHSSMYDPGHTCRRTQVHIFFHVAYQGLLSASHVYSIKGARSLAETLARARTTWHDQISVWHETLSIFVKSVVQSMTIPKKFQLNTEDSRTMGLRIASMWMQECLEATLPALSPACSCLSRGCLPGRRGVRCALSFAPSSLSIHQKCGQ